MKRVLLVTILGMFCNISHLNAMDVLRNIPSRIGQSIENVTIPLVGTLTNIMPIGIIATSFKEYPGQTMMLLTGLVIYALSRNESIRETFEKYKRMCFTRLGIKGNNSVESDETLFIFDGEDEDDAEHEMEIEDELLDDDNVSSDDDRHDISKQKKLEQQHQPVIKFL